MTIDTKKISLFMLVFLGLGAPVWADDDDVDKGTIGFILNDADDQSMDAVPFEEESIEATSDIAETRIPAVSLLSDIENEEGEETYEQYPSQGRIPVSFMLNENDTDTISEMQMDEQPDFAIPSAPFVPGENFMGRVDTIPNRGIRCLLRESLERLNILGQIQARPFGLFGLQRMQEFETGLLNIVQALGRPDINKYILSITQLARRHAERLVANAAELSDDKIMVFFDGYFNEVIRLIKSQIINVDYRVTNYFLSCISSAKQHKKFIKEYMKIIHLIGQTQRQNTMV